MNNIELTRPTFNKEITVEIPKDMPEIKHNLGELKDFALKLKDFYSKLVFSDDSLNEASKEKTRLNKLVNEVKRLRIDNIKKYKEPIESFESTAKEIEGLLNEAKDSVQVFIDKAERQRREDKLEKVITPIINRAINNAFVKGHLIEADKILIDDRWFNKTFKDSEIEKAINAQIDEFIRQEDDYKKGLDIIVSTIEMASQMSVEKDFEKYKERFTFTRDLTSILDDIKLENLARENSVETVSGTINGFNITVDSDGIDNSNMFEDSPFNVQDVVAEYTIRVRGTVNQLAQVKTFIESIGMEEI